MVRSFRKIFFRISLILLIFLITACRSGIPEHTPEVDTQDELMDYYREIYGENCVIQLPQGEYYRVVYPYDENGSPKFEIRPLNREYELYTGDVFTCYPEKPTNKVGEDIVILIEHHDDDPWLYPRGFLLEILVDGQWYALNLDWYYPGGYSPMPADKLELSLPWYYLSRVNIYEYNEELEKYEVVSVQDRPRVQMRPGHYRCSTFVGTE